MKSRTRPRRSLGQSFEPLEDRSLLAAFFWDPLPGQTGHWQDPTNWYDGTPVEREQRSKLPGLADSVSIGTSTNRTDWIINVAGEIQVASLTIGNENAPQVRLEGSGSINIVSGLIAESAEFAVPAISAAQIAGIDVGFFNSQITVAGAANLSEVRLDQSRLVAHVVDLAGLHTQSAASIEAAKGEIDGAEIVAGTLITIHSELRLRGVVHVAASTILVGPGPIASAPDLVAVGPGGQLYLGRDFATTINPNDSVLTVASLRIDAALNSTSMPGLLARGPNAASWQEYPYDGAAAILKGDLSNSGVLVARDLSIQGNYRHLAEGVLTSEIRLPQMISIIRAHFAAVRVSGTVTIVGGRVHVEIDNGSANPTNFDAQLNLIGMDSTIAEPLSGRFNELTWGFGLQPDIGARMPVLHYDRQNRRITVLPAETPRKFPFGSIYDGDSGIPGNRLTSQLAKDNLILVIPGSAASGELATEPDNTPAWSITLARTIQDRLERDNQDDQWDVAVLDWSRFSTGHVNDLVNGIEDWRPWTASNQAISIGEGLARWMVQADLTHYQNIHVLSHSAGSYLALTFLDELDKSIPESTFVHLTLFDAFAPPTGIFTDPSKWWLDDYGVDIEKWGGDSSLELNNFVDYAEHYVDRRKVFYFPIAFPLAIPLSAVPFTDYFLPGFINHDVTYEDDLSELAIFLVGAELIDENHPGRLRAHAWPYLFYQATVSGTIVSEIGYAVSKEARSSPSESPSHASLRTMRGTNWQLTADGVTVGLRYGEGTSLDLRQAQTASDGALAFPQGALELSAPAGQEVEAIVPFHAASDLNQFLSELELHGGEATGIRLYLDDKELFAASVSPTDAQGSRFTTGQLKLEHDLSPGSHTLRIVLAAGATASARFVLHDAKLQLVETYLADQLPSWQNPARRLDVNVDGDVTLADFQAIAEMLAAEGIHVLPTIGDLPSVFVDVDGDSRLNLRDLLPLVNHLLSQAPVASTIMAVLPLTDGPTVQASDSVLGFAKSEEHLLVQSLAMTYRKAARTNQFARDCCFQQAAVDEEWSLFL